MGHRAGVAGVAFVVIAAVGVASTSPAAAAACTFDQVTHDDGIVVRTAVDGDGDRVAFSSTMDLTGQNADHNLELFLWDAAAPGTEIAQLTNTVGSAVQPFFAIDDSGDRIAVLSPRNLAPGSTNTDLNVEAFLYDRTLDTFVQLTTTTGANVNKEIAISGDGNRVAVTSSANLTTQNADGSTEVFVRTFQPNSTVQVTSSPDGPTRTTSSPSLDLDGDRVVFESNANLVPPQNPGLGEQIFLRDLTAGTTTQLTNYPAGTFTAATAISANGAFVVHGTGQPIAGPNEGNFEFYRTRLSNGAVVRLTDSTGSNAEPALSAAGDRLVWLGESDLPTEGSSPVYNLNASDVGGSRNSVALHQGLVGIEGLAMSTDGTRLAFATTLDLIGQNGSHDKALFVATCGRAVPDFTDVPRTNPFFDEIQWMHRAGVASGFPDGTFLPLDAVKRQQMANFLFNLAGNPLYTPPSVPDFTDVPVTHPMYQAIEWMAEFGIADGFPDGTFRPTLAVKRQQMANFLYNLAGEPAFTPPAVPTFTDVPTTNPFFLEIEWMADQGIASGFPDGTFLPLDPVKRQQMANFVYRFQRVTDLET